MTSTATSSFLLRYNSRAEMSTRLPPLLYRVYCGTFQRQISTIRSLNSHAAFIVVLDDDIQALVWAGSMCSEADRDLALQIAKEIMLRDFGVDEKEEIPTIYEAESPDSLLEAMVNIFGSDLTQYSNKIIVADRREEIQNGTTSVGTLVPLPNRIDDFERREKSFAHPDLDGIVPRVEFVYIEKDTLAYVITGSQYDLWIARGVSEEKQQYAVAFMERLIDREVYEDAPPTYNKTRFLPHLQVVYQGEERYAFRRPLKIFTDFEPAGRTVSKEQSPVEISGAAAGSSRSGKSGQNVSFAQLDNAENEDNADEEGNEIDDDRQGADFQQQRAAAMSAIRRADAGKAAKLPITFSEFRLEEENEVKTPRAGETATRMLPTAQPLNFWNDVKPQQTQRQVLFGEFVPENPDYAPLPKVRMSMGDKSRILPHHFDILEHENLDLQARKDLLMRAKHDPQALLGWQIEIDEGLYCGIYVIIGYKKSMMMRKTSFQAIAKDTSEHWLRLARGYVQHGLVFRPLRQVARVSAAAATGTDTSAANMTSSSDAIAGNADNAGYNNHASNFGNNNSSSNYRSMNQIEGSYDEDEDDDAGRDEEEEDDDDDDGDEDIYDSENNNTSNNKQYNTRQVQATKTRTNKQVSFSAAY